MSQNTITTPLCAHCGRPMFSSVWLNGLPYHYECTQSPYMKRGQEMMNRNHPAPPASSKGDVS